MSLNAVSKHIRVLEQANLIRRRRAGREHLLTANPKPLEEAEAWIGAQRMMWTEAFDALEALLRAEDRQGTKARKLARQRRRTLMR